MSRYMVEFSTAEACNVNVF